MAAPRIRDPQGFWLGILFLAIAVPVVAIASGYRPGTATEMGPGYFPRLVGVALAAVGAAVILAALRRDGPGVSLRASLRPVLVLLVAVLAFAAALQPLGLVAATVIIIAVAALASPESRVWETLASAAVVAGIAALVFVKGLGMQVPLWPGGL